MRTAGAISELIKDYSKTKILILLEHEGQVKDCLVWLKEIKGQKQVIALSPFAIYELDKQHIPYLLPEDYYDCQELYQLGLDNYPRVENICATIDSSIHRACPITAKTGIRPALFSIYHLKVIYDAATIRLFQLFKIINAEKPGVIFIYDNKSYPFGISEKAPYLFFDNRESIYGHLLALAGWKIPIVVLPHIQQPEETYIQRGVYQGILTKLQRKVAGWLQRHPQLLDLTMAVRKRGWHGLYRGLRDYLQANKRLPVLLFGAGYNWENCREELQSAGIRLIRMQGDLGRWLSEPLSIKVNSDGLLAAWQELQAGNEFRKFFTWGGIDFFPVVKQRLQFLVERLTLACLKAYEEASGLLEDRGIMAVLTSVFSNCTEHSVAQAAHNAGVPVVMWQHGSWGYMEQPMINYEEIMGPDVNFVFGEGVAERHTEPARRFGTKLIPIGSASLEALAKKKSERKAEELIPLNPEKKVVLYVTTNYYQNNLYISFSPPFSDNQYWHTQQAILDVLSRHQDYTIVVKTHPTPIYRETSLGRYARGKGFKNCQFIKDECSFNDLLPLADVFVIDSPTTTLLQALTTSKPIFAYTGHLHIDEEAQKLLGRRTSCHRKLEDFLDALEKFLSGGVTDADLNDTEFLKRFGTHERASKARAVETLNDILRNYTEKR